MKGGQRCTPRGTCAAVVSVESERKRDIMYGYGAGPQDWLLMLAMMAVMTVLTVVAVVAIVRAVRGDSGPTEARQALDYRYASGEVSTEEYRERMEQLSKR